MKGKAKRKKKTPEEKLKSDHRKMVRSVFSQCGFLRAGDLSDKEFIYDGQPTDFDDVYVYENILVCLEYTTTTSSKVSDHLKPKKIVYDKIARSDEDFAVFYCDLSPTLKGLLLDKYNPSEIKVAIVYCSYFDVSPQLKHNVPNPVYLGYPELRYFKNLADCIRKSAVFELLEFLRLAEGDVGQDGKIETARKTESYPGSLLPESSSNFNKGYKVVSFYAAPKMLLKCAYVLRNDGWRSSYNLYQRMISKTKIDSTRRYLKQYKRVFVNNIIATLPADCHIIDANGVPVDHSKLNNTKAVEIQLPWRMNSIGIIDGQHRTYAYHEAVNDDQEIGKLRTKQNLLVTGIIYPKHIPIEEMEKFEARLFLEINSTQTSARSNLRQAIAAILDPFSVESIATRVLESLDRSTGPLGSQIERYFFDKNKLKSTSIVSYALKPLVKTTGIDSLFFLWEDADKGNMVLTSNYTMLDRYVAFCTSQINMILSAAKSRVDAQKWTTDKSVDGHMLNTTTINSLLICLRLLIGQGKASGFDYYRQQMAGLDAFQFKQYHSSQYKQLANKLFETYFG
ncbi:DGQHR domain-containing protein [Mesorhizobium australicum WSM2073]|uniref:DGQHR domain-containing protein n=1 Tax=Mesorhizobium australicum (strain HAMBI 3006 / LMG 24608 / WSM2073) TaxID=754035 RepID=L0KFV6_MESAW|nr:DGQHR domain-containing protein [Mesorhizobium australicum]AGB43269.1 DGQHR domain-containing protein [Mesorhizobium australicum WSM2073]